jgi:hypothetical protein
MIVADATFHGNLLQLLTYQSPAEIRTSTSAGRGPLDTYDLRPPVAGLSGTGTSVKRSPDPSPDPLPDTVAVVEEARGELRMAPWLQDTMQIIDTGRQIMKMQASSPQDFLRHVGILDTAEKLASLLVDVLPSRRPQLNVDDEGYISFATTTRDFYLNLTVDSVEQLTWYAVVHDVEYFMEQVSFSGRRLPDELKKLLSM